MSEITIFRSATEDEKKDFIEVGKKSPTDKFLGQVAAKQQEFLRKYLPYCSRCAYADYEQTIKQKFEANASMVNGAADNLPLKVDLDKYGDISRFELVDVRDVREDKLLDGIRNTVVTGKEYLFKCKTRGCGHAVFVDNLHIADAEKAFGMNKDKDAPLKK